ncbi:MAG: PPOX class F420-dependent oxidoreductase [Candidatus Bathyarchaeia archaeon]|jgi:PPOX class probable F420-dependent enzyme
MASKLTPNAIRLIEGNNLGFLATLLPDGSPHVTPVWVDHEGDIVLVNTSVGRVKQRNIERDPRVMIAIADSKNPYDRVIIRGRVQQTYEEAHIDKLANKYTGAKKYQRSSPTEKRVILKIEPQKIS